MEPNQVVIWLRESDDSHLWLSGDLTESDALHTQMTPCTPKKKLSKNPFASLQLPNNLLQHSCIAMKDHQAVFVCMGWVGGDHGFWHLGNSRVRNGLKQEIMRTVKFQKNGLIFKERPADPTQRSSLRRLMTLTRKCCFKFWHNRIYFRFKKNRSWGDFKFHSKCPIALKSNLTFPIWMRSTLHPWKENWYQKRTPLHIADTYSRATVIVIQFIVSLENLAKI